MQFEVPQLMSMLSQCSASKYLYLVYFPMMIVELDCEELFIVSIFQHCRYIGGVPIPDYHVDVMFSLVLQLIVK